MWQSAFVAMSVTLGESLDDALAALGEEAHHARALENVLRTDQRDKRARAIAQHLAPIASDLDAMETTWRA
jgi:hypothetical protein